MGATLLATLAIAALFVAPLVLSGELGWYSFDEPRSHLVWDEAMGEETPRPVDGPGGARMLVAQLAVGAALLVGMLAATRRSRRVP